jgi:hypothetical protein
MSEQNYAPSGGDALTFPLECTVGVLKTVLPPSQNSCPTNKIKGVLIGCLLVILPWGDGMFVRNCHASNMAVMIT